MTEAEKVMSALVDAINRRDRKRSLGLLTLDVQIEDYPAMPDWRLHHGHEGVLEWTRTMSESFPDLWVETRDYRQVSDRFFFEWRAIGRGSRSGIVAELMGFGLGSLKDGRLCRLELYGDRDQALAALSGKAEASAPDSLAPLWRLGAQRW
jgi:hypothetical protein